jgi:large subunit ribosomal protein L32
MAVPRQKHTKSRRDKGRMHLFLEKPVLTLCPKCGKETRPHAICWNCGYYKGEQIVNVLEKLSKKEKKKRQKEMKTKERGEGTEKPLTMEELSRK